MVTKYSVIRYLPRPLSGEAINIGVVAWTEGKIHCRFINSWQRASSFGREDINFLREFAHEVEESISTEQRLFSEPPVRLDVQSLERIVADWNHSIEFSEPRASLKSPEVLLAEIVPIYLLESQSRHRARDRRTAAHLAVQCISAVLREARGELASKLLKKHYSIDGQIDQHVFDVVVKNGHPLFVAQGLSFEKAGIGEIQKDVDATAWAVDDVRKLTKHRDMPIAILALPPRQENQPYARAKKIFKGLDALVLSESEMSNWVKKTVRTVLPTASFRLES